MRRIYVVAEADAGDRDGWPGPDRLRPITRDGWRQARAVAEHLRENRPSRIVASPWLRCRQTVTPLAEVFGLDVDEDRALAEPAPVHRVLARVAELPDAAVVCTHADLVRQIVTAYAGRRAGHDIGPWVLEIAI